MDELSEVDADAKEWAEALVETDGFVDGGQADEVTDLSSGFGI